MAAEDDIFLNANLSKSDIATLRLRLRLILFLGIPVLFILVIFLALFIGTLFSAQIQGAILGGLMGLASVIAFWIGVTGGKWPTRFITERLIASYKKEKRRK